MLESSALTVPLNKTLEGKVAVIDTSSLLNNGLYLLSSLHDCEIVIPTIVIKELEAKREGLENGFLAREWLRLIESIRVKSPKSLREGVELEGYKNVKLKVEINHTNLESLPEAFRTTKHDNIILAVAKNLANELGHDKVVLVSNDTPMRIHASVVLGIQAHEYTPTDTIKKPFIGRLALEVSNEKVDEFGVYSDELSQEFLDAIEDNMPKDTAATSFTEITVGGKSTNTAVLVTNDRALKVTPKTKALNITGKTLEQNVLLEMLKLPASDLPVVSIGGGAGTGKTLLTLAVALEEMKYHRYEKIMVFRSLHELGQGQEMGFLPGSVDEKMGPWAGAIYDAIDTLAKLAKPLPKKPTEGDFEKQKKEAERLRNMIEVAPITYLRGRSLHNTFMVLEEAQNFSRSEILNILSRAGKDTKIILTADSAQVDNRFLKSGKDADVWSIVDALKDSDIFGHITLTRTERSRVAEVASRILEGDQA